MASLLVVCFFPAFTPASSGGELRLSKLYRAVAAHHDVTLLTSTDFGARYEEISHTPRFREIRFPKDEHWRQAYVTLDQAGVTGELSGLAFALAVSDPKCLLSRCAHDLAAASDLVIHEFPFSEPIFSNGCPCPEIYNAHNVEASLLASIVAGPGLDRVLLRLLRLEGNLVRRAKRVFATSQQDLDKFRLFYGGRNLGLCPNGFDPVELAPVVRARATRALRPRPQLLFLASAHAPNVEAARFLLSLASDLAECDVLIAGGVCGALSSDPTPANVALLGPVDAATRERLLSTSDLCVNPVIQGSGTSLKAVEALGVGLPMVSTPEGVRGLGLTGGAHAEVVPREEFAATIRRLLADTEQRDALGAAGKRHAEEMFSWEAIASHWVRELGAHAATPSPDRTRVLALNDYSILRLRSGGAARVRALLENLDCDVVLVTLGSAFEVEFVAPGVLTVIVPKNAPHRAFEAALNAGQPVSANDVVASLFVRDNSIMTAIVSELASRSQAVIFEHPYLAPLLDLLAIVGPTLPVIYSAHNVEATHKAQMLAGHSSRGTLLAFIAELERRLVTKASLVICCTEEDAREFSARSARILVVPNGCDLPSLSVPTSRDGPAHTPLRVGFMGSAHGPNVTAARFIQEDLALAFPEVHFELLGSVGSALAGPKPANLLDWGAVAESRKTEILVRWDIALNPLATGGGSSLKLADYLGHGLPTLSTPTGARGFAIIEHEAGRIAPLTEFRAALADLIQDANARTRLQQTARHFAAGCLDWQAVVKPYRRRLQELRADQPPGRPATRLLVVTYRYTEPALGGAEQYLLEVLTRLRPRLGRLDLAAIDVGHLTNRWHFGCELERLTGGGSRRLGELFDQTRFFAADDIPENVAIESARQLEGAWCREEFSLLTTFLPALARPGVLRIFSGFFHPEHIDGKLSRWTAPVFSFLVPTEAETFEMRGVVAAPVSIQASVMLCGPSGVADMVSCGQQVLAGQFHYGLRIPPARPGQQRIVAFQVPPHTAPGDHRPLGVRLSEASVLLSMSEPSTVGGAALNINLADLSEVHEDELRRSHFTEWTAALRDTATTRGADMEAGFAQLRGPHSAELQSWLEANAAHYDTVLVQGIPFDVIPSTVETLSRLPARPRLVTLPHFHGDDRFYHWRRYAQAFAAADATLLFSTAIALGLDPSINALVVPGGGVRPEERADFEAEQRFRKIHPGTEPYFLVLGRKIGSKGYDRVIAAHQELRRAGVRVSLVLVGPDEDKVRVSGEAVYNLGPQPRPVVLGALRGSLGLVTMSRSESFGIVVCEAWLAGKPVIANAACYAFRALVRHGANGLLVTSDADLLDAMRALAEHPDQRHRLGAAGLKDVMEAYTWEHVANSVLQSLLSEGARASGDSHG